MRKFKGAIISILVLLLLIGGYFIISNIEFETESEQETEAETQPFGDLITVDAQDIIYMGVENSSGKYSFSLENGIWHCNEDRTIVIDQNTVSNKVFTTSYYDGYTIVEGTYKPSDFGLDNPTMIINIALSGGEEHTFTFGSLAPVDDFLYYMTVDERPAVYAIFGTKYDMLNLSLGAYRDAEFFALDYNDIKQISIRAKGKDTIVLKENSAENAALMSNWVMTSPYNKAVNEFTFSNYIIAPLTEQPVEIVSYVEDNPGSLAAYGLDDPAYVITFDYAEKSQSISLGNTAPDGGVYAMKSGSRTVYTVDYNRFSFVEYSPFELIDKSVYYAHITDLASFKIDDRKNIYEIKFPSKGTNYTVNGKKVSEEDVKSFYNELALLSVGGVVKDTVSSKPAVVFTYNYRNGSTATVEFIQTSARQYAVRINGGKTDFYVKKADVSNLISKIAEL